MSDFYLGIFIGCVASSIASIIWEFFKGVRRALKTPYCGKCGVEYCPHDVAFKGEENER